MAIGRRKFSLPEADWPCLLAMLDAVTESNMAEARQRIAPSPPGDAAPVLATPPSSFPEHSIPLPNWRDCPDGAIVRDGGVAHTAAADGSPIYTPLD